MRGDPPVRSVNPFPPPKRIDAVMVALSFLAIFVSPVVMLTYGGTALIFWFVGVLVVNCVQIVLWRVVRHLRGDREDEVA